VNRRVLFVDPNDESRARFVALASRNGYEAEGARSAPDAHQRLEQRTPFACVLADYDLGDSTGIELFARVREIRPGTSRVLLAGFGELDRAVRALHEGSVLRLLQKPLRDAEVLDALRGGTEQFEEAQRERQLTEELTFSRDALLCLMDTLERRLSDEIATLQGVHDLARRLESARSLDDVARVAAQAISHALGGRSTRVEFPSAHPGLAGVIAALCSAASGPERLERLQLEGGGPVVYVSGAETLTARDQRVISSLVSSTALAAHGQIHKLERDEAEHATVFALARLAERRDNETGQHLERVSNYCRMLALGLREDGLYTSEISDLFVSDLTRSAPLHDIGKVGIPDEILLKPGKLDPQEWEIMKRHTVIGGDTLRSIIDSTRQPGFLSMGYDVALCHHERWDGSGYPSGLEGLAIPLGARILALADVYDALTTRRPYKEPWSHGRALELIQSERGKHFDPAIVDAFVRRAAEADKIRILCPDEELLNRRVA
jgi:response regulator RpfG family c-di-GMP phosphodiesterase